MKPSRLKGTPLYIGGGLIGGLVIGMGIVIIAALMSDRLLRRDDVAAAFGAPVRLSVGPVGPRGRLSGLAPRRGRGDGSQDTRRVVEHLSHCVPGSSRGPASLAVVAVDDVPTVAKTVASLAEDLAADGRRVLLADVSVNHDLARLLDADQPGVNRVAVGGSQVVLAVPEPDDVAPVGPVRSPNPLAGYSQPTGELAAASDASDVILSLVTLEPAFGGDHLATWAADAVAVVTAGKSTATRVQAVGEMIRLSGTRADSAVLLGADKNDESLGARNSPEQPAAV